MIMVPALICKRSSIPQVASRICDLYWKIDFGCGPGDDAQPMNPRSGSGRGRGQGDEPHVSRTVARVLKQHQEPSDGQNTELHVSGYSPHGRALRCVYCG